MLKRMIKERMPNKILALTLILSLTFVNVMLLGSYFIPRLRAYATGMIKVETGHSNVEFDAYFLVNNEQNNKTRNIKENLLNQLILNLYVNVKDGGYLKDAVITLRDPNNGQDLNFNMLSSGAPNNIVEKVDVLNNAVKLKQVDNGTSLPIQIPIALHRGQDFNLSHFNQDTSVTLKGTYVLGGKSYPIEGTAKLNIKWEGQIQAVVNQDIEKYFKTDDSVLIQYVVRTSVKDRNNGQGPIKTLPIKTTNIKANLPKFEINGQSFTYEPSYINVVARSTYITNGQKQDIVFEKDKNWSYSDKVVNIKTENLPNADNLVNLSYGNSEDFDEYLITYVYPKEVAAIIGSNTINVTSTVNLKLEGYNGLDIVNSKPLYKILEATADNTFPKSLKDPIGNTIIFRIQKEIDKIEKGYMYNNFANPTTKNETEYKTSWIASIGQAANITSMLMNQSENNTYNTDSYNGNSNTKYAQNNTVYYKQTSISKSNFNNILGESGSIKIYNATNNALIAEINKNTEVDQDGNYYINYAGKDINNISIETSKPITEGDLKITHTKNIKDNLGTVYTLDQVKDFAYLNTHINGKAKVGADTAFRDINVDNINIPFSNPYTKATIAIKNPESNSPILSVTGLNKNVMIEVVLLRNSEYFDLYKEPVIQIELPNYIEDIQVNTPIQVFFADGLAAGECTITTNASGNKILTMKFTGEQNKYVMQAQGGTRIQITADIKVKFDTPSVSKDVKLYYYNAKATTYNAGDENTTITVDGRTLDVAVTKTPVSFQAPTGMFSYNSISNFDDNGTIVTGGNKNATEATEKIGKIDANGTARTVKMTLGLVNYNNSECTDITLLGRIPFKDNKYTKTGTALGSIFDTTLKSGIQIPSGVNAVIYYSENAVATKDVTATSNGWVENPTDLSKIKSYLIVLKDYVMPTGKSLEFSYDFEIPANIELNNKSFGTFIADFSRKVDNVTEKDYVEPEKVGIGTEQGPVLEIKKEVSVGNNTTVKEYQVIKYTITVKNTGTETAKNVVIEDRIPDGTTYGTYASGTFTENSAMKVKVFDDVGDLKAGESAIREFYVRVNSLGNQTTSEIRNKAVVKAVDIEKESNEVVNPVDRAKVIIEKFTQLEEGIEDLSVGTEFAYEIRIQNVSGSVIKNAKIEDILPEGLTYVESGLIKDYEFSKSGNYNPSTRKVTWDIGNFNADEEILVTVTVKVEPLKENEYERKMVNVATLKGDGIDETSNEVILYVYGPKLEITKTSDVIGKALKEGQEIVYTITVKNTGKTTAYNVETKDKLPEGVTYISATPVISGTKDTGEIYWNKLTLDVGESIEYKVKAVVKNLPHGVFTKEIKNFAVVNSTNYKEVKSNEVINIVQKPDRLTISGLVWQDENRDGRRQETEKLLPNIEVVLVSSTDTDKYKLGNVIRDKDTNEKKRTFTKDDGTYTFANLEQGDYYVIFIFDGKVYGVTTCKKAEVPEDANSDGLYVDKLTDEDQNVKNGAITEEIKLVDVNKYHIDLGLVENPKFDLGIKKYVNKVTVQNRAGTSVTEYNNVELAKVDIKDSYMKGSNVTIEYKFVVTNEGDIPGIAKKIIDNFPADLVFNPTENPGWAVSSDGKLYYEEIKDTVISPGESKEFKLIATTTLDSSGTITIPNTIEIKESYNDLDAADINSANDFARAETLLTIKTGQTVIYFTLTFVVVALLGGAAFIIKKKVLI